MGEVPVGVADVEKAHGHQVLDEAGWDRVRSHAKYTRAKGIYFYQAKNTEAVHGVH